MTHTGHLILPKFKRNRESPSLFQSNERRENQGSTEHLSPHFSFEKMQTRTGYSVACCQLEDRAALASKLFELSQITWAAIRTSGRHQMGYEKIARSSLKTSLPSSVTEDTVLLAFRFNGKAPMIGYRDGRTFYVLLLDWNFSAYRH